MVDDVAENRMVVCDMLEASDGETALAWARNMVPDLILMDIIMLGMDGLQAINALRQDLMLVVIPVIVVSASASGGKQEVSLAAGANAFLPKPLYCEHLLAHIASRYKRQNAHLIPARPLRPSSSWSNSILSWMRHNKARLDDGMFVFALTEGRGKQYPEGT